MTTKKNQRTNNFKYSIWNTRINKKHLERIRNSPLLRGTFGDKPDK